MLLKETDIVCSYQRHKENNVKEKQVIQIQPLIEQVGRDLPCKIS